MEIHQNISTLFPIIDSKGHQITICKVLGAMSIILLYWYFGSPIVRGDYKHVDQMST